MNDMDFQKIMDDLARMSLPAWMDEEFSIFGGRRSAQMTTEEVEEVHLNPADYSDFIARQG